MHPFGVQALACPDNPKVELQTAYLVPVAPFADNSGGEALTSRNRLPDWPGCAIREVVKPGLFPVTQIFNLLYRRIVFGRLFHRPPVSGFLRAKRITNPRHSRVQLCATLVAASARWAVSRVSNPHDLGNGRTVCRLEVGDTAGWKPALQKRRLPALAEAWEKFGLVCGGYLAIAFFSTAEAFAGDPAILRGLITDSVSGLPAPCTVSLVDSQNHLVTERESFQAGFRCLGRFEKSLPPGPTRIRVTRGLETRAVEKVLDLRPGAAAEVTFSLERVVDLRQRGWYAGDSHAHMQHGEKTIPVDFDFVALTAQAEDLHYLSLCQAWPMEDPTPEKLEAEFRQRSTAHCVLTWNLEAPKNYFKGDAGRCLGHCWTVALRGRIPEGGDVIQNLLAASAWDYESAKPSLANFESHQLIHAQGGAVFYSHPLRWWTGSWGGQGGYPKREQMRISNMAVELPLDTLIGPTYDGLDVITGGGEFSANAKAFELWALLLNHGYRLAATASSDSCFDRPGGAVPGTPRTYTYLTNGFSLAAVARALAEGRTFVTTGPLLLATIDGMPPGVSLPADNQRHTLKIEAWASGADTGGLRRLEVWRKGTNFQRIDVAPATVSYQTNLPIWEGETSWYCVRALGSNPQTQRAITGAFFFEATSSPPPQPVPAQVHARLIEAHTGKLLEGTLTEVTFYGTRPHEGRKHPLVGGAGTVTVPGTVRLRAESPDHVPLMLSPFFDYPALIEMVTALEDKDLLDWRTFERVRELLGNVPLTFALEKRRP